jgi:hypothetical protein
MGENCTASSPQELLNKRFTPIRIISKGKIQGCIHTLTLEVGGLKTLVICGIEPKSSMLAMIDADEFVKNVVNKLIDEVAKPNGYKRVCFTKNHATISNRWRVASAINRIIEDKPDLSQKEQETFPQGKGYGQGYNISELKMVWESQSKN